MKLNHRLRPSIMMSLVIATAMGCSLVMDEPALKGDSAAAGGTIKGTVTRASGGGGPANSAQQSTTLAAGGDTGIKTGTVLALGGTDPGLESTLAGGAASAETSLRQTGVISTAMGGVGSSETGGVTSASNTLISAGGTESVRTSTSTGGVVATSANLGTGGASTAAATGAGGTTATGGVVGSGGTTTRTTSTPAKLTNGASCSVKSQCASDYCVDGYCCNTPCDGVCASCSLTPGTCSKPPTDSACIGTVSCPADTICVDYTMTTTQGECSGLGSCAQACSQTFAPARTSCADSSDTNDGRICDGGGNCKQPQVVCGAGSNTRTCNSSPGFCCRDWDPTSTGENMVPGTATCVASTSGACQGESSSTPVSMFCDGPEDCASGLVCCHRAGAGTNHTKCSDPSSCKPVPTAGIQIVCRSNADCTITGTACVAYNPYPELKLCMIVEQPD